MSQKNYLVKKRTLIETGIKDANDLDNIIVFDNMSLRTSTQDPDPKNFIIPTEGTVNQMVLDAERNSHKQIKGEITVDSAQEALDIISDYDSGNEITLDGGETYIREDYDVDTQPNGATVGDVIFFVPSPTANSFKTEEVLVKSDLSMILLSSTNVDDARLTAIETNDKAQDTTIKAITDEDINNLKVTNDKDVTGHGALVTDGTVTEGSKLARRDEITSPLAALKQEADANKVEANATAATVTRIEPIVDSNAVGVLDYQNSKADFLRLEDVAGSIEVDFNTPLTMTEDGQDIVVDLTALTSGEIATVEKFVQGRLITIQATPNDPTAFPTEYARDSWNDGSHTSNVLLGRDVTILSTFSANGVTPVLREIRLSDLNQVDRTNFINDFKITALSQLGGSAGAGIDQVARTAANAAQVTANSASSDITQLITNVSNMYITLNGKQDKTDTALTTSTKSIVGAINEVKTRADNDEADIDELNLGKFDVNGDGSKITEIFDTNGDLIDSALAIQMGEVQVSGNRQLKEISDNTDPENVLATEEAVDDKITAAINVIATFTFDDNTTADYKLGK